MKQVIYIALLFIAFIGWVGSFCTAAIEYDYHEAKGLPADYSLPTLLVVIAFIASTLLIGWKDGSK
jgi:hypothetical protein